MCGRCEFVCSHVPPVRRHDAERDRPGFTLEENRDLRHREKVVDEPVVMMRFFWFAELAFFSYVVCEEIPEVMDVSNHLDVVIEQLGVVRRASQYDCLVVYELTKIIKNLFKQTLQHITLAQLGQDGVEVALQQRRSVRGIKDLRDAAGLSGPAAAAVVVMKNDR